MIESEDATLSRIFSLCCPTTLSSNVRLAARHRKCWAHMRQTVISVFRSDGSCTVGSQTVSVAPTLRRHTLIIIVAPALELQTHEVHSCKIYNPDANQRVADDS